MDVVAGLAPNRISTSFPEPAAPGGGGPGGKAPAHIELWCQGEAPALAVLLVLTMLTVVAERWNEG